MTYFRSNLPDLLIKNVLRDADWSPHSTIKFDYPVDIFVTTENLIFEYPIVNANTDDIVVELTGNILSVKYHRSNKQDDVTYIRRGITRKDFEHDWSIDPRFDLENLVCSYKKGIFEIKIPFKESALPKRMKVHDLDNINKQ